MNYFKTRVYDRGSGRVKIETVRAKNRQHARYAILERGYDIIEEPYIVPAPSTKWNNGRAGRGFKENRY